MQELGKGGIDGPAGPANAGALPRTLRNAGPLFASVMSSIPPTLFSRCGNPDTEHAYYYIWQLAAYNIALDRKTTAEVTLTCNYFTAYVSVVFVLNDIVLVLAVTHELVPYHFYSFYAAPVRTIARLQ